ncbi:MAG: flagellar basal body protein FliL, partial [Gammaproteobacteria bacterium]
ITNFSDQSQGEVRYMQIKLKVMARDQQVIDAFKLHLPAIQHELLLLFHGQNYDELTAGTKELQKTTLNKINAVLKPEKLQNKIEAVYFTSFLMQ